MSLYPEDMNSTLYQFPRVWSKRESSMLVFIISDLLMIIFCHFKLLLGVFFANHQFYFLHIYPFISILFANCIQELLHLNHFINPHGWTWGDSILFLFRPNNGACFRYNQLTDINRWLWSMYYDFWQLRTLFKGWGIYLFNFFTKCNSFERFAASESVVFDFCYAARDCNLNKVITMTESVTPYSPYWRR